MSSQNPIRRKLVIVGDGACGKTSLLCCFALGEFPKEYQPTIFENYVAEIRLDGKAVQLALWDTAGQEEYERLRPLSYSKSHVILIAFAIDTTDSLDNVQVKWIEEVRTICGPSIPVILVGCKSDLRPPPSSPQSVSYVQPDAGKEVARLIGARAYKECSALKAEGVDDVFEAATRASMLVREGVPSGGVGGRGRAWGDGANGRGRGHERRASGGVGEESGACGCCVLC